MSLTTSCTQKGKIKNLKAISYFGTSSKKFFLKIFKRKEMLCLYYFYYIFITNFKWHVVTGCYLTQHFSFKKKIA